MIERRCSGHCCKAFIIPCLSHPALIESKRKTYIDCLARATKQEDIDLYRDNLYVCDMLIPLGTNISQFPIESQKVIPNKDHTNGSTHYYTCKHHDSISGDCLDYEHRPHMCRQFPLQQDIRWNGSCVFEGCTKRYSLTKIIAYNFEKFKSNASRKIYLMYKRFYYKYMQRKTTNDVLAHLAHIKECECDVCKSDVIQL